jgi:hypothetical protein
MLAVLQQRAIDLPFAIAAHGPGSRMFAVLDAESGDPVPRCLFIGTPPTITAYVIGFREAWSRELEIRPADLALPPGLPAPPPESR